MKQYWTLNDKRQIVVVTPMSGLTPGMIGAIIPEDTHIPRECEPFWVSNKVTLGKCNWFGPDTWLSGDVTIGDNNHFAEGSTVEADNKASITIGSHAEFHLFAYLHVVSGRYVVADHGIVEGNISIKETTINVDCE